MEDLEKFAAWRNLEPDDVCLECSGSGVKTYGSTATWTGGIGGQVMTSAVCDQCWGSGSKSMPWLNLWKLSKILSRHPEVAAELRASQSSSRRAA